MRALVAAVALAALSVAATGADTKPGAIHTDVPAAIDASRLHLFYLHGAILERQGRNAVQPEYGRYAKKVADQVRRLLAAGVPPGNVTVTGFSKGGALTLLAAAELQDPRVRFVVMAGCGRGGGSEAVSGFAGRMKGRMLSLYDEADREAGSCQATFARASAELQTREIRLTTGRGHGLFYGARAEWLDLVAEWARGEGLAGKP